MEDKEDKKMSDEELIEWLRIQREQREKEDEIHDREMRMFRSSETNRINIKKANEDIEHLIRLNKKQMMDFESYHRQFITLSAFLVACILAILFHVSDFSINIALPETIAQSKIWLWISYPYHFLVNILPKDSFIFDWFSAELFSFLVVVFIFNFILFGLLPASQRRNISDEPKWIISYLIMYPIVISFFFLFGFVLLIPFSFLVSLFT